MPFCCMFDFKIHAKKAKKMDVQFQNSWEKRQNVKKDKNKISNRAVPKEYRHGENPGL